MSSSGVPLRKSLFWKPEKESSGLVVLIKIERAFPLGCIVYLHTVTPSLGHPSLNYEKRYFCVPGRMYYWPPPPMPRNGAWVMGRCITSAFGIWYFLQTLHLSCYDLQNSKVTEKSHSQGRNHVFGERAVTERLTVQTKLASRLTSCNCCSPVVSGELLPRLRRPPAAPHPTFGDILYAT